MIQHKWLTQRKSCVLINEFGRECEKRKLRVNVRKSSYEELNVCKLGSTACATKRRTVKGSGWFYLRSQVAADGG